MMEKCWNCNSQRYWQTARFEKCPDCGIECDYHGDGANVAYDDALERQRVIEREKEWQEEFDRLYGDDE